MKGRRMPYFIGIGAPRCGTTWIAKCIQSHPELYIPEGYKELHFFDGEHYDRGLDWYESFFSNAKSHQKVGEFTPRYLREEMAPELIYKHYPHVKLLVCLRNPIDRAFSHYRYLRKFSDISPSFYKALFDDRYRILASGLFGEQLERYLHYFPKEQMLILYHDDFSRVQDKVIKELYTFLNVDSMFTPEEMTERINPSQNVKLKGVTFLVMRTKKLIMPMPVVRKIFKIMGFYKLGQIINKLNISSESFPVEVDPESMKYIKNFYLKDIVKLESLLEVDLSSWNQR